MPPYFLLCLFTIQPGSDVYWCDTLLIGFNCPDALAPLEVILGERGDPFAQRTILGWSVVGRTMTTSSDVLTTKVPRELAVTSQTDDVHFVCQTKTADITTSEILKILEADFQETKSDDEATMSQEDMKFVKLVENGIKQDESGYYEMPLPFKADRPQLPNNKKMAEKRLSHLKRRFDRDQCYFEDYKKFMDDILAHGDAEEVEELETPFCWYIPHHGVYHAKKNKIRIVFDCSAQYQGTSLNQHLLQGPDQMNSLVGVLCRFRERPVAVIGDIERMFHQFRVTPADRNYLRFLWWKNGDLTKDPISYRMKVHLFGATSSPGCAMYGLRQLAKDHGGSNDEVIDFLTNDFYVDDGLRSFNTVDDARKLIEEACEVCRKGNVRLHKFLSNSAELMETIPETERAKETCSMDLCFSDAPIDRVLGVQWCVKSDMFKFRLTIPEKPLTRRGILSTVASVFDPLGCLAPFILLGKQILQQLCRENFGWDDNLPDELRPQWERWLSDLPKLEGLEVQRCYVPEDFGVVTRRELHHFSDASTTGYGQCSYLRMVNSDGKVVCSLVMAKSRVAPSNNFTFQLKIYFKSPN